MPTVTVQQAFALAQQHHQAGRLAEAEALYRQILAAQPNHADALHYLGVIAHDVGRDDMAVEMIRRAIDLDPENAFAYCNYAEACRMLGRLDEAVSALHRALQIRPAFPEAHNNLGIALLALGRLDEAAGALRRALELNPDYLDAHNNLGNVLAALGCRDEALAAYRRAMELGPNHADAHNNLGNALAECGQSEAAVAAYRRALEIKPDNAEASNNLGNALLKQGELDEAIISYRRALELKADYPGAWRNLGVALAEQGRLDEAVAAYHRALELKPHFAEAYHSLADALKDQGRLDEALDALRRIIQLKPADPWTHGNVILSLLFHPDADPKMITEEQQRWNRQFSESLRPFLRPHANDRDSERRLRVGYVSSDFRDHVAGRNLLPLFKHHDHHDLEIVCYTGSTKSDDLTECFRDCSDLWRSTAGVADEALAEMIRRDGVDILVDLSQHMAGNRLQMFARQPAPVQVSFAGYPDSTGLEAIGYRISDRWVENCGLGEIGGRESSLGEAATKEQVLLIDSFWCYDPCGIEVPVNELPAQQSGRVTFGSLNIFSKVNVAVLKLWARVLGKMPDARLVLLSPEGSPRQRTVEFFEREGIAGDRVQFVARCARQAYLELYHRLDIVLDPFPYNGHTTSLDALWMGVPVVSLAGKTRVSRGGLSILTNLGLPELATFAEEEYVEIASRLANDLPRLAALRATLRARMEASVLMDAPRFARQIEAAYRTMWRQWCAGPAS